MGTKDSFRALFSEVMDGWESLPQTVVVRSDVLASLLHWDIEIDTYKHTLVAHIHALQESLTQASPSSPSSQPFQQNKLRVLNTEKGESLSCLVHFISCDGN